jgi:hypothetical protein
MGVGALKPAPRSGYQWLLDGDSLLLFGGYYKEMKHKKLYDSSKASGGKAVDDPDEPSEVVRPNVMCYTQLVLVVVFWFSVGF